MDKRYLFFIGTMNKGGAQRVMALLTDITVRKGHNVELLVCNDSEFLYDVNPDIKINVIEQKTHSRNLVKNLLWLRKYIKNNADIVISFLTPFNMMAICASLFLKIPVIVSERNDPRVLPEKKVIRFLRDIVYLFADRLVVQTEHNKRYFSKKIRKKCDIIPNPIDLKEKTGQALKMQKEKVIVSTGRLIKGKNHTMLIKAFAELHQEFPDYKLIIYGEGTYRKALEQLICELGMEEFVFLPGNVKDVFDPISVAELFVLSSDSEGMSNSLLEAMCLGLPVISTRVSGATDIITDGKNGLLVDIAEQEQMIHAIRRMLADDDLRGMCAKNAAKLAKELTVENIYEQWIETCRKATRNEED